MTPVLVLILVLAGVVGLAVLVLAVALLLWRKAQLIDQQRSIARVEFLRLSRSYGVGRG